MKTNLRGSVLQEKCVTIHHIAHTYISNNDIVGNLLFDFQTYNESRSGLEVPPIRLLSPVWVVRVGSINKNTNIFQFTECIQLDFVT